MAAVRKIAVLGATGPTGQQVVRQAVETHGWEVVALVRSPDRLETTGDKVKAVKVNIFNEEDLVPHMEGCDAVISCLGIGASYLTKLHNPDKIYSRAIAPITAAMRRAKVDRIICMTGWYTEGTEGAPFAYRWFFLPLVGRLLQDARDMETHLTENCQDLNFTVVRPSSMKNANMDDRDVVVEEEKTHCGPGVGAMPYPNVAKFIINCVQEGLYLKKKVAIGLPKIR